MPDAPTTLEYLVPVFVDSDELSLTIEHPDLRIRPGDRVIWDFVGLLDGWAAWIEIKAQAGSTSFLGPFETLAQIDGGVWGAAAADAQQGSFTYRACIQKGVGLDWETDMATLCSPQATLTVHTEPVPDTAIFTVSPAEGEVGKLEVSPETLDLVSGQAVAWRFEGFSGDASAWRPRIDFGLYEGDGTVPVRGLGPFTCLLFTQSQVTGLGNSGVTGSYHFQVSLLSAVSGEVLWINSGDPAIDNQGPIWDPVSGGPQGG